MKSSAWGVLGAGLTAKAGWPNTQTAEDKSSHKIKGHRVLGRTGFKVSDLATGSIMDEGLLSAALDAGFNYIDTAEEYPGHHKIVGAAIKGRDRKSVFITSKLEMKGEISKEGIIKRTRKALEEIGTEYLDCMMMHFPENAETLKTPGYHEAMQELKAEGRIRFTGASHHGSFWFKAPEESMAQVLLAAAEDGRFDVFLMTYNFLQIDQGKQVLEVCQEKKIGTALMKTSPVTTFNSIKSRVDQLKKEGKDVNPFYQEGLTRYQAMLDKGKDILQKYNLENPEEVRKAAIRFCLDNPHVNTVCCSMKTYDDLEWIVRLSGEKLSAEDKITLASYEKACGGLYCRHACGLCEPQCPHSVPINTIMRYHHYFVAQGREKEAMQYYTHIPGAKADLCESCQGYCEPACPYNVSIHGKLIHAHSDLSLV